MSRGLKIEDLYKINLLSQPNALPDCSKTLFTVAKMSKEEDRYISKIWLLEGEEPPYPITKGPSDHTPIWSPNGKKTAFLSRRTLKDEERGSELWIYPFEHCSEPYMILKLEGGIENIRWSPNGDNILFLSNIGKYEDDVKVIEKIPIWFNGKGLTYNLLSHLFILNINNEQYSRITEGEFNVIQAEWCGDARHIVYLSVDNYLKPYIRKLYLYDVETGETNRITEKGYSIWEFTCDPTGRFIAFIGHDLSRGLSTAPKIWLVNIESKEIRRLYDLDYAVENAVNSDVRGIGNSPGIQWVNKYIYFPVAYRGRTDLYRVDAEGNIDKVIEGDFVVDDFSVSENCIISIIMNAASLPEIYMFKNTLKKISSFNENLLSKLNIQKPISFSFRASDGVLIDGWILKPVNYIEDKKYPMILEIHGGPATSYGEGFMHEFHILSNNGYVVAYINPRGSSGYTEEFRDIRGDYGNRDYKDIMESIEYLKNNFDFIDFTRMGVTGGSYGGFMTNWIIGHTDIFKAAVTQRSISNWISDYGTTDIGYYFNEDQIAGGFDRVFWDDKWIDKYWSQSPIKYIGNAKTPLLIIHSMEDYRCWLDQALQMFTALKRNGVKCRLLLFPKENHDLSRRGKPKHRVRRLEEIIGWFDKFLK